MTYVSNVTEYKNKLITADKAASLVQDDDYIIFSEFVLYPREFDKALAKRAHELKNVAVKTVGPLTTPAFVQACDDRSKVAWIDSHFSPISRQAHNNGLCNYISSTYYQWPRTLEEFSSKVDMVVIAASPMDKNGFFNFGLSNSGLNSAFKIAKRIVVITNSNIPRCLGGVDESIHISMVDYVVEGEGWELPQLPDKQPSQEDIKIAELVIGELVDGSCIQLGIGALPTIIGNLICDSDIKDIGVHTEMLTSAYVKMYNAGKITNRKKNLDKGRMVYTFAMGNKELYDFLDDNRECASFPAEYTNSPAVIALNDNLMSINNAIEVDLFGQVSSESTGFSQISGTGGQLDFTLGAFGSKGGKGLICLNSTFTDKKGKRHSRIRTSLDLGTIVTVPRSVSNYIVTEYGIAQMKGQSTWGRAEALINIAHPDFREDMIKEAEKMKIWKYTNKKV